ncbi:MAG: hypothetical protein ACRCXT_16950 [Paraclostridium sp.]
MKNYYTLLGLHTKEVVNFFKKENKKYTITTTKGYKDQDKLVIPRVIKIVETDSGVEIIETYFSDSLY